MRDWRLMHSRSDSRSSSSIIQGDMVMLTLRAVAAQISVPGIM